MNQMELQQEEALINSHFDDLPQINTQDLIYAMADPHFAPPVMMEHLTKPPQLEDIDTDYNFQVCIPNEETRPHPWYHNSKENRVYLKMGSVFTVNVQFDSPHLGENMFLRMMCVFTCAQDIHDPVNRCPNHIEKDHEKNTNIMDHIVRCRRPDVMYYGAKDKVAFSERLAMVLPMGRSHIKSVSDTIGLEFMCQNSCAGGINRRATALMFILENQRREILGRKLMHFRVCTSPKRDFMHSINPESKKRVGAFDAHQNPSSAKRPMICRRRELLDAVVKTEAVASTDDSDSQNESEMSVTLTLENKDDILFVLELAFNKMCGDLANGRIIKKKYYKQLQQQIETIKRGGSR